MPTNTSWCDNHRESANEPKRLELRSKIELLPKYEGSDWYRHKCPFCAYEEGFKEGVEEGKRIAAERIKDLITN